MRCQINRLYVIFGNWGIELMGVWGVWGVWVRVGDDERTLG